MFGTRIPASLLGIYVVQVTKISDFKGSVLPTYRLMSYIYIHIHIYIYLLLLLLLLLALQPTMDFSLLSDSPPFLPFLTQLSPPSYS